MNLSETMHVPVLKKEVIEFLDPRPNQNFIDCTVGEGGHTLAILEKTGPRGKVLAIDKDKEILKKAILKIKKEGYGDRVIFENGNFSDLKEIVRKNDFNSVSGILADFGISSWHFKESGRGFSFSKDEPLDMRLDKNSELKAQDIVNKWSEAEIENILREYGEERFSRRIAKKIIETRKKQPIKTTFQLIEIVGKAVHSRQKIHPATRSFQALRIAVNNELNNIKMFLPQIIDVLDSGAKAVIISFHSLEDRIVKNFLKSRENKKVKILTKKPVRPGFEEIKINPGSRSAKLRAFQKLEM